MTRELTAIEILEVAERMEREAARFYRKAAGMYNDPRISKLFSELAQWEKRHVQVFADMKERLARPTPAPGRWDVRNVDALRLDVPPPVFNERSEPAKELTGSESRTDVFELALEKEKYTIAYYTALTEFALGPDNLRAVKEVLEEERRHVKILAQSLAQTRG